MRNGIQRIAALFQKRTAPQTQATPPVLSPLAIKLISEQLFDSQWYSQVYSAHQHDPLFRHAPAQHFLEQGAFLGLNPAPWFDSAWYLAQYGDVHAAGLNPLVHYLQHGIQEHRQRADYVILQPQLPENQFMPLRGNGLAFQLPIFDNCRSFNLSVMFQQSAKPLLSKPCGIVLVECFSKDNHPVVAGVSGLNWSESLACWYRYLVQKETERLEPDTCTFTLPAEVVRCQFTIKPWNDCAFELRNRLVLKPLVHAVAVPEPVPSSAPKALIKSAQVSASELKVALISDEFTYNSFKDEFQAIVLEPDTWRAQLDAEKPALFFCESAWSGVDTKRRPWKGKIYASENFAKENRGILLEILQYCREQGIPTLFWNKEDPTHYPDRKHDFVKTAALFDYVFTTAAECVEQYKQDYQLSDVFALPFATNPRLFNPLTSTARSEKVVFAGSWYANHVDRSLVMEQVLDALIASGYEPEIYDRYYGDTDPLHLWPEKYLPYIHPGKPHDQMPAVYKSSIFGLNFNTVTESSTMFARRVFELMSSNTLVISNYAKGVAELFADLVVFADTEPTRLASLSDDDIALIREQALLLVLTEHTYAKRWRYMLQCIGFTVQPDDNRITLVSTIASDAAAMASISYFEQHFGRNADCSLLLVVSAAIADVDVADFYQKYNRFGITVTSESYMQKHAQLGQYCPVQTPYFMLFQAEQAPNAFWLDIAKLHLSYQEAYPIAQSFGQKYQLAPVDQTATLLAKVDLFAELYQARMAQKPVLAYTV